MQADITASSRGELTREALLVAATQVFARDGFHAASLRDISDVAGINQALIGYHFRNKEGLYLAVFERMVAQIRQRIGPILDEIDAVLEIPGAESDSVAGREARSDRYLPPLLRLTDGLVALLTRTESDHWAQLILREQQAPTAAFSLLYEGFMRRVLSLLTQLVQRLHANDSLIEARLLVTTILGQLLVFRAARAGVLRLMEWERIGDRERAVIQAHVRRTLNALLVNGD